MLVRVIPVRSRSRAHAIGRAIPLGYSEADGIGADIVLRPIADIDVLIIRRPKPIVLRKVTAFALVNGGVVISSYQPLAIGWHQRLGAHLILAPLFRKTIPICYGFAFGENLLEPLLDLPGVGVRHCRIGPYVD